MSADSTGFAAGLQAYRPGGGGTGDSGSASTPTCPRCQWSIVPVCAVGSGGPAASQTCDHAFANCPPGQVDYRVYMRPDPTSTWAVTGAECLSPSVAAGGGPPVPIPSSVASYFQHMPLPLPGPSFQPAAGAVVNVPTIFSAGSGNADVATLTLGGVRVRISARPSYWMWTFDDGVTERFNQPGGPYPDTAVSYTYHEPGTRTVTVTAVWTATYQAGGTSAAVPGAVHRSASVIVPVYVARSELVSQ